jgi:hypothetical protein
MNDPTEADRRRLVAEINTDPLERAGLEAQYGKVWDTKALTAEFDVHSFMAPPFVFVTRKKDGVEGILCFQHLPRYYFDFKGV